jgi:hypothetical protein
VTARIDSDEPVEQVNDVDREYAAPMLIELGTFEELTQGMGTGAADGGCSAGS